MASGTYAMHFAARFYLRYYDYFHFIDDFAFLYYRRPDILNAAKPLPARNFDDAITLEPRHISRAAHRASAPHATRLAQPCTCRRRWRCLIAMTKRLMRADEPEPALLPASLIDDAL